jgi:hypothetical protein
MNTEIQIIDSAEIVQAQESAIIDKQIATAKTYPRDLKKVVDNSILIATLDKETAQSMGYTLPRGGKNITGGSVHLAKIIAAEYGNLRVQTKVVAIDHKEIIVEATAHDLEKNYAVRSEIRRKITDKYGNRFNDDMINVTGRAANSIAFRNVIFDVVPKGIWEKVYNEAMQVAIGELSDETKMLAARKKALDYFETEFGATEADVLNALNLRSVKQIKANEVQNLRGLMSALKDGEITANELFGWNKDKEEIKKDTLEAVKGKKEELNTSHPAFDEVVKMVKAGKLADVKKQFEVSKEVENELKELAKK